MTRLPEESRDPSPHDEEEILWTARLLRYMEGETEPQETAEIESALRESADLRARLAKTAMDRALLAELHAEEREADRFTARAGDPARRRHASARRRAPRRTITGSWLALALAAGVLLVLGLYLATKSGPTPRERAAKPPALASADKSFASQEEQKTPSRRARPTAPSPGPLRPEAPREPAPLPPIPAIPPAPPPATPGEVQVSQALEAARQPPPQSPKPTFGADEGKTERPLARIAKIVGRVSYARGAQGKWIHAVEGIWLLAGDRLDTRGGMARLDLGNGSVVYANRNCVLRLLTTITKAGEATLVNLTRGEVYIADEGHRKICVETADALLSPVGTRFQVHRRLSSTLVTVDQGAVEVRVKSTQGNNRLATSEEEPSVTPRRRPWLGKALLVAAGQQLRVPNESTPRPTRSPGLVGFWRQRLGAFDQILLLPRHGRVIGEGWRLVKDARAPFGLALEAPRSRTLRESMTRPELGYVEFTFHGRANRKYYVWILGRCVATKNRQMHDAVALLAPEGRWSARQDWMGWLAKGDQVQCFNGFGNFQGYEWLNGDMFRRGTARGGLEVEVIGRTPVTLVFPRSGQQTLRLYAVESPIRVDAIWISSTQKTRPDVGRFSPLAPAP